MKSLPELNCKYSEGIFLCTLPVVMKLPTVTRSSLAAISLHMTFFQTPDPLDGIKINPAIGCWLNPSWLILSENVRGFFSWSHWCLGDLNVLKVFIKVAVKVNFIWFQLMIQSVHSLLLYVCNIMLCPVFASCYSHEYALLVSRSIWRGAYGTNFHFTCQYTPYFPPCSALDI